MVKGVTDMAAITNHAKKRLAERVGASSDSAALKNANRALKRGIRHDDTIGDLNQWILERKSANRNVGDYRVFRGYLYIFSNGVLITVYSLPDEIKDSISENMLPSAYGRYMDDINGRKYTKQLKNDRKYKEKRERFNNLVLLNDVRQFADDSYDVRFTGVNVKDGLLSICYIPYSRKIPCMQPVADYMQRCTNYPRVRLVHVRDINGQKMYAAR